MIASKYLLPILFVGTAQAAVARDVVVEVDAGSGPWVDNKKGPMPFGVGDQKPPVIVPFDVAAGKVEVFAEGTTDTADKKQVGPEGIDDPVDDKVVKKRRYPSFYTPKVLYPANRHALVVIFVDKSGSAVSRPVMVGSGVAMSIPDGAEGVALGFNDVTFAGNSGKLKVTVGIPE
jgi:hypothetical protein